MMYIWRRSTTKANRKIRLSVRGHFNVHTFCHIFSMFVFCKTECKLSFVVVAVVALCVRMLGTTQNKMRKSKFHYLLNWQNDLLPSSLQTFQHEKIPKKREMAKAATNDKAKKMNRKKGWRHKWRQLFFAYFSFPSKLFCVSPHSCSLKLILIRRREITEECLQRQKEK